MISSKFLGFGEFTFQHKSNRQLEIHELGVNFPFGFHDRSKRKNISVTFLYSSGVGQEPIFSKGFLRTFTPLLGSTDETVRPQKTRNFFKVTQPVKGRAG